MFHKFSLFKGYSRTLLSSDLNMSLFPINAYNSTYDDIFNYYKIRYDF